MTWINFYNLLKDFSSCNEIERTVNTFDIYWHMNKQNCCYSGNLLPLGKSAPICTFKKGKDNLFF